MNKIKKTGLILSLTTMIVVTFAGCSSTADTSQAKATNIIQQKAIDAWGWPDVKNFTQYHDLATIYAKVDEAKLITYGYLYNDYTGKYEYMGQGYGYLIPYGTEFTNPLKVSDSSSAAVIKQADPDALFHADGTALDWWMQINPTTGLPEVTQVEPQMIISTFKQPKYRCDPSSLPDNY